MLWFGVLAFHLLCVLVACSKASQSDPDREKVVHHACIHLLLLLAASSHSKSGSTASHCCCSSCWGLPSADFDSLCLDSSSTYTKDHCKTLIGSQSLASWMQPVCCLSEQKHCPKLHLLPTDSCTRCYPHSGLAIVKNELIIKIIILLNINTLQCHRVTWQFWKMLLVCLLTQIWMLVSLQKGSRNKSSELQYIRTTVILSVLHFNVCMVTITSDICCFSRVLVLQLSLQNCCSPWHSQIETSLKSLMR